MCREVGCNAWGVRLRIFGEDLPKCAAKLEVNITHHTKVYKKRDSGGEGGYDSYENAKWLNSAKYRSSIELPNQSCAPHQWIAGSGYLRVSIEFRPT